MRLREVTALTGSSWYRGRLSTYHGGHEDSSRLGFLDFLTVTVVFSEGLDSVTVVLRFVVDLATMVLRLVVDLATWVLFKLDGLSGFLMD